MNLRYLETFLKVCELGSFTAVADLLCITQPGVSRQIQRLEQSLGVTLLERDPANVRLTAAGRQVYEAGKDMLARWEALSRSVAAARGALAGRLRIGASTVPAAHLLPPVLRAFHDAHPFVELSIGVHDSRSVIEGIRHGQFDVGVAGADPAAADLWRAEWGSDHLVVVAPADGPPPAPAAGAEGPPLPLILREPGSGTRAASERAFADLGMAPERMRPVAEVNDTAAILALVRMGLGCAAVSHLAASEHVRAGHLRIVREILPRRPFYLVCREDRRERDLARAFLAFAGAAPPVSGAAPREENFKG